ncbi:hypothetical protein HanIR_Chr17g0895901 [Helianthus annuus]|nr:hypothetical protein HanIR_Chr17g0895901 [Helianthus annuus]
MLEKGPVEKLGFDFDTGYQNPFKLLSCVMARMDNVSETVKYWPKLINIKQYVVWKEFETFVQSEDARIWSCMIDGYIAPTYEVDGRFKVTSYKKMQEYEKRMYDAEKKALAAIKMSLPLGIKHTFNRYGSSRELWKALEKRYQISSKESTCNQACVVEIEAVKIGVVVAEAEKKKKADEETAEKKDVKISKGLNVTPRPRKTSNRGGNVGECCNRIIVPQPR